MVHTPTSISDDTLLERVEARLPQPSQTKISAVLNGMGNGATVGLATYALPKVYAAITHQKAPADNMRGSLFATAIGTSLGTWYGLHEAKAIEAYRDSIGKEIIHLRDRVRTLEGKPQCTHTERLKADRDEEAAAEITR